jgi:hypothetical protein
MLFCNVGLAFILSIRAEFEGCGGDRKKFENLYGGVDLELRLYLDSMCAQNGLAHT